MSNDNNINIKENKLNKFIAIHKKAFLISSCAIFLIAVLVFCIIQTLNYNKTLSLFLNEVEENQQLSERLELETITMAELEQLVESKNQEVIRNKEKWDLEKVKLESEIAEWQDRYYEASFEYSHIRWAMRLHDMDGPLYVPADMDRDLIDFVIKHYQAWYTGDVETYKSTVSLEWQPELMSYYIEMAEENDYYRVEVKFIKANYDKLERYDSWGGFIYVTVLEQEHAGSEPSIKDWPTHIVLNDGKWFVRDYH